MKTLIALVCGLAASLTLNVSAGLATPWYGVNDASVTGGLASPTQSAALARDLNASSSRLTLNWAWVQPTDTTPNFSTFDAIYRADIAAGIRPLIQITGSPNWATTAGANCPQVQCNYPPSSNHFSDWHSIVTAVAQRYPQAVGIEIWNEPNMSWAWGGGIDPAAYTQLLKLAYQAVKAVDPNMPVIAGSLATDLATTTTSDAEPMASYLQGMYQAGASKYMNALSIHPYPGAVDLFYTYRAMALATEVRDSNSDNSPLWITETGLSTDTFTGDQQAEVDSELVKELMSYPGVGGVYLSTMVEPQSGGAGLGLLTSTLGLTPSFCSVAQAAGTSFTCPSSVTVPTPTPTQAGRWQAQALLQAGVNAAIAYYAAHGTYTGLTSAMLHAIDSRVSSVPADGTAAGAAADPSRIGVFPLSSKAIMLCDASTADLSYCAGSQYLGGWTWSMSPGSIYNAYYAFMHPST